MEIKQPKPSGSAFHKQFMRGNTLGRPRMPLRPAIAILLTVLVAVPAGLLIGNMYLLGNSQQQDKEIADIARGPNIVEPEKPQENIAPELKTPQQEVVMRPEPPRAPKEAPPENMIQSPQEGAKQQAPQVGNALVLEKGTLIGASMGVRRAWQGEGNSRVNIYANATLLLSFPKLKEGIEKYEADFSLWEQMCNANPARKASCEIGDIPAPGLVLLQITNNEFVTLKAQLNPDAPLESKGVRADEIRRFYASWVVYNDIRYLVTFHTAWTLP